MVKEIFQPDKDFLAIGHVLSQWFPRSGNRFGSFPLAVTQGKRSFLPEVYELLAFTEHRFRTPSHTPYAAAGNDPPGLGSTANRP
jgi:hypothetical protein